MRKQRKNFGLCFVVIFSLTVFLWICGSSSVLAVSLLDGDLKIGGYLKNDFAVRLSDGDADHPGYEAGDLYQFRNTLQIESKYEMNDVITAYVIYRAWYDAAMDFDSDLEALIPEAERDGFRKDSDFREAYLDIRPKDWLIRAGKQQIVWGESDGFRMADIINPLDYSGKYFFPSWEDIRIPVWALRAIRTFDNNVSAEFVFIPNFIENYQHTAFPPAGANWAFRNFPQFFIDSMDLSLPEKDLGASEYGARLKYNLRYLEVGMFGFYKREQDPVLREDWLTKPGLGTGSPDAYFDFPYAKKVGGTFNTQLPWNIPGFGIPVLRGECVYTFDKHLNSTDMTNNPRVFERDVFAYMLGYDAEFYSSFINPSGQNIYHSFQIFQEYLIDSDKNIKFGDPDDDNVLTLLTYVLSTNYFTNKLNVTSFTMYNPDGEFWSKLEFSYTHKAVWNFGIAGQAMWVNRPEQLYFGGFNKNDEIYGWVRYTF